MLECGDLRFLHPAEIRIGGELNAFTAQRTCRPDVPADVDESPDVAQDLARRPEVGVGAQRPVAQHVEGRHLDRQRHAPREVIRQGAIATDVPPALALGDGILRRPQPGLRPARSRGADDAQAERLAPARVCLWSGTTGTSLPNGTRSHCGKSHFARLNPDPHDRCGLPEYRHPTGSPLVG
jgi:hypothetical protein